MSDVPFRPESATPARTSGDAAPTDPPTPPPGGPTTGASGASATGHTSVERELDAGRRQRVAAAARRWQRTLADVGGPNTLLWYQDLPSGTLDLTTAHPGGVSMLMAGRGTRLSDLVREPSAFVEARRRADVIRNKVRELESERGLVTGFMAIGMATWDVPGARRAPQAPVLLRSCTLRPTDPAHRDYDLDLDPRVHLNPVLVDYLALERGITVDPDAITDIAYIAKRFDPMPAFREVARLCRSVPGFRIADRRVLGTFSYAKSPMVADLAALGDDLARHDLVAALAGETDALGDPTPPRPGTDPGDGLSCFDVDAEQQGVVDAVRAGGNAIVRGAPGTGRTQTIAALAAGLVADGKRVLVVGQKRSGLTSVVDRLAEVGLDSLVLDLHEGALDRGRVARLVVDSLAPPARIGEPDLHDLEASLAAYRERLERHRDAMHCNRAPWDVSVAQAHDALAALTCARTSDLSDVRLTGDTLRRLDVATRDRAANHLRSAAALGAWSEQLDADPWARARIGNDTEAAHAHRLVSELSAGRLTDDRQHLDGVFASVGVRPATTVAHWGRALDCAEGVRATLETFTPEVFGSNLDDYVGATAPRAFRKEHDVRLPWWTRWGLRRELKTLVRPEAGHVDLHARVAAAAAQRATWRELAGPGSAPCVPDGLDAARARYTELAADLAWLGERLRTTPAGGRLHEADLDDLAERLARLVARDDRLEVVPRVIGALDALDSLGLTPLVDDFTARQVPAADAVAQTEHVWWHSVLDAVAEDDPRIGAHDGTQLRTVLEEYVRLDSEFIAAGPDRVRTRARSALREAMERHPRAVEVVREQARRTSRHLPLRTLVEQTAPVLTAARPIWVMSPLVVASVLPPGQTFDVLVVEDGAQVEPAQLASAAARSARIVVFGDEAQIPPRPFLTAASDADQAGLDDVVTTDAPTSVLDVLRDALPVHRLRTEYRSRDERLVALAARHLYDGDLDTFPGTLPERPVSLVTVAADDDDTTPPWGDATSTGSQRREIDEVVRLVIEHARTRGHESLAVLTLNAAQAHRLTEALRVALDDEHSPEIAGFFADARHEPFVVLPVERADGDVRDAVILSVGYSRAADGRVTHRFGPLNLEGGERRLGVALTAARTRLTVVSSLTADCLDPRGLSSRGVHMLRDLLAYAAGDETSEPGAANPRGDSPAERPDAQDAKDGAAASDEVRAPIAARPQDHRRTGVPGALLSEFAARLRREGLVVHENHGTSTRRVDLAVEDPYTPGRVVVAVEGDGTGYAAQERTRDRDRLRAAHLRDLGWEHVQVWGLDVFADPATEVARVLDAVRAADAGVGPTLRPRRVTAQGGSGEPSRW